MLRVRRPPPATEAPSAGSLRPPWRSAVRLLRSSTTGPTIGAVVLAAALEWGCESGSGETPEGQAPKATPAGAAEDGAGATAETGAPAPEPQPRPMTDREPDPADPVAHGLWKLGQDRGALLEWHDPEPTRVELAEGEERDLQTVLLDGRCYRAVAASAPGIEELDLLLFDPNGVLVREDPSEGPQAVLGDAHPLCVDTAGAYRLQLRARKGAGEVGVRMLRSQL